MKKKQETEEDEYGPATENHPIFRQGWCVGLPLSFPERPAAPLPEPPPAGSTGEAGASDSARQGLQSVQSGMQSYEGD